MSHCDLYFLQSLAEYERSKESYKKALALLPVKGLTKENITLKEQCETGLNDVQRKIEHTKPTYTVILKQDTEKMPWHRAVGMDKERLARLGTVNECARSSVRFYENYPLPAVLHSCIRCGYYSRLIR